MMGTGGGGGGLARFGGDLMGLLKLFVKAAFVIAAVLIIGVQALKELGVAGVDVVQIGVDLAGAVPPGLKALIGQAS